MDRCQDHTASNPETSPTSPIHGLEYIEVCNDGCRCWASQCLVGDCGHSADILSVFSRSSGVPNSLCSTTFGSMPRALSLTVTNLPLKGANAVRLEPFRAAGIPYS